MTLYPTPFVSGGPQATLYGTHANRPLAAVVPDGSTYAESDTSNTYQARSGAWVEVVAVAVAPSVQSITGTLAEVTDTNAKSVLTSIITALVALDLATNNTT